MSVFEDWVRECTALESIGRFSVDSEYLAETT